MERQKKRRVDTRSKPRRSDQKFPAPDTSGEASNVSELKILDLDKVVSTAAGGLYYAAGSILKLYSQKRGLPKQLCMRAKCQEKKSLLALVTHTLQHLAIVRQLLDNSDILRHEKKLDLHVAMVLIYDAMLAQKRGGLQCGGYLKKVVARHSSRLSAELVKLQVHESAHSVSELLQKNDKKNKEIESFPTHLLPRWTRLNLLVASRDSLIRTIQDEGFQQVIPDVGNDSLSHTALLEALLPQERTFVTDPHLPDVIAFAPSTDLHESILYTSALLILQDKASCFPAHALAPPPGAVVVDACAAPGNKTSHMAALMGNTGTIHAFDTDDRRLGLLQRLTEKAGATCIHPHHGSFLDIDVSSAEFREVTHILLDPSCSGSGMVTAKSEVEMRLLSPDGDTDGKNAETDSHRHGRKKFKKRKHQAPLDAQSAGGSPTAVETHTSARGKHTDATKSEHERVEQLANFQVDCIVKAMSFPNVQRISYSTCSVHVEENEDAVARGVHADKYAFAPMVIRAERERDGMTGFFVAVFERISNGAESISSKAGGVSAHVLPVQPLTDAQRLHRQKRNRKRKDRQKSKRVLDAATDGA